MLNKKKNHSINATVGLKIKNLRKKHKITQLDLAKKLDISISYINLIENDRRKVTAAILIDLSRIFNIKLKDLVSDNKEKLDVDTKSLLDINNEFKINNQNINIGLVIRKNRREKGVTQLDLAKKLNISVSYVNLIENNRRKVTVPILLDLAKIFNIELSDLTSQNSERLTSDLLDVFSDTLFDDYDLRSNDIRDFALNSSLVGDAVRGLYDKYQQNKKDLGILAEQMISFKQGFKETSYEEQTNSDLISDLLQSNNNYFNDLEELSKLENKNIDIGNFDRLGNMVSYLMTVYSIDVNFIDIDENNNAIRRYIPERKQLIISKGLTRETKEFLLAQQIGLLTAKESIENYIDKFGVDNENSRSLGKTVLANYYAGALLMPYDLFWKTAEKSRYDIDVIANYFETSFEQVCHRLTTLQRKDKRGIPFHFLRVDLAGNISKRFSMSGLKIPRYSVACPRWNVYTAFLSPGKIKVQVSRMLDGKTYLCLARTMNKKIGNYGVPETFFSIGLGFDINHADKCIYSDGIDLNKIIPTGLSCRTCERMNCRQRAFPPIHTELNFNENIRGLSGYITPE